MKVFKKIMNAVAAVENCILVVSTLLILVLTVGNVFCSFYQNFSCTG
jgi:C4-dicarboxylate transporter DctQ subunit